MKRIQRLQQKSANEADVDVLSVEEEKKFCSEALSVHESTGKYRYAAGLYGMLLLHTGMRCGEMLALRWRDVDFEHGFLTIEKADLLQKS